MDYYDAINSDVGRQASQAILTEDLKTVKQLLETDKETVHGIFPLQKLASLGDGNPAICQVLIESGADVAGEDAVRHLAEMFTKYSQNPTVTFSSPLHLAASYNCNDMCRQLIEAGADVNAHALVEAPGHHGYRDESQEGELVVVKDDGDCILRGGETPLHKASAEPNGFETCKLLIDAGADVNAFNGNIDSKKRTALMQASRRGSLETMTLLLEHGADVHARDHDGVQAIEYAMNTAVDFEGSSKGSDAEKVKLLVNFGADPNMALLQSAMGDGNLVQFLLENGADPDYETDRKELLLSHERDPECLPEINWDTPEIGGNRALHFAGNIKVAQLLIDAGATVNATDWESRETPLHRIARSAHQDAPAMVQLLLDHGADPLREDINGNRARPRNYKIMDILKPAIEAAEAKKQHTDITQGLKECWAPNSNDGKRLLEKLSASAPGAEPDSRQARRKM